jgi:hypothetical protein
MPSRWDNGSLPHGGDDITQRGYAIGSHLTVAAMIAKFPHVTAYIAKGGARFASPFPDQGRRMAFHHPISSNASPHNLYKSFPMNWSAAQAILSLRSNQGTSSTSPEGTVPPGPFPMRGASAHDLASLGPHND